jgi:hypothetical protein
MGFESIVCVRPQIGLTNLQIVDEGASCSIMERFVAVQCLQSITIDLNFSSV